MSTKLPPNGARDLSKLIDELVPRLYQVAYYQASSRHAAEDAVQETIVRFLTSAQQDPGQIRSPLGWCLRVLTRLAHGQRAKASREVLSASAGEELSSTAPDPVAAAEAGEHRALVRQCLADLPAVERSAIALHVFGNVGVREIASMLELPKSTVHDRIQHGLATLRQKLKPLAPGAFAASALEPAELTIWLRHLPPPPVPATLEASVQALTAGLSATAASGATTSISITGASIMAASTGKWMIAGAGLVLLAAVGTFGIRGFLPHEGSDNGATGNTADSRALERELQLRMRNDALSEENAKLRRQLAALETEQRDENPPATSAPTTQRAAKPLSTARVEHLLAMAMAALEAKRADDYMEAFLALIDAGEAAHTAMLQLLARTGNYNQLATKLGVDEVFNRKFIKAITAKNEKLSGFLDRILTRDADPDKATLFAAHMMRYNEVESDLSPDELETTLARVVERAVDAEGDHVEWNHHAVDIAWEIGRGESTAALPLLAGLLAREDVSDRNRLALARAVARIGSTYAIEILRTLREVSPDARWSHLLRNLLSEKDTDRLVRDFLEGSTVELSADDRSSLLRDKARDPKNLDDLAAALDRGELDRGEQRTVLEFLLESGKAEHRDVAWHHYEEILDEEDQEDVIAELANKDPRATEKLLERLRADDVSWTLLTRGFSRLNNKIVLKHRVELATTAANNALKLPTRAAASTALARIDPQGAVDALMQGYWQAGETHRLGVVGVLQDHISDRASRLALDSIADSDTSESIRKAAKKKSRS